MFSFSPPPSPPHADEAIPVLAAAREHITATLTKEALQSHLEALQLALAAISEAEKPPEPIISSWVESVVSPLVERASRDRRTDRSGGASRVGTHSAPRWAPAWRAPAWRAPRAHDAILRVR